jgi:two-component system, LytTR family, sensor kinase
MTHGLHFIILVAKSSLQQLYRHGNICLKRYLHYMPSKRYSIKRPQLFFIITLPYVMIANLMLFGVCIYSSLPLFLKSLAYTSLYMLLVHVLFVSVAQFIRGRLAANSELLRRIAVMLPVFYVLNMGVIAGLLFLHRDMRLVACPVNPAMYWWTVLYGCIVSTVTIFIIEGLANWEKWKGSLAETEKLRNAYQRSRLLGLKGQINPHFLFNCFNTLSGLIHEDENDAEKFLEEMTRVHRYLLRNGEDLLVPVADEMKFAASYLYLTKTRFGSAIDVSVQIGEQAFQKLVPPLSMHVILENIIYTNALNKSNPLTIEIRDGNNDEIYIRHSVHEKTISISFEENEGLDNLLNKYKLLNAAPIMIREHTGERIIVLPMLQKKSIV